MFEWSEQHQMMRQGLRQWLDANLEPLCRDRLWNRVGDLRVERPTR